MMAEYPDCICSSKPPHPHIPSGTRTKAMPALVQLTNEYDQPPEFSPYTSLGVATVSTIALAIASGCITMILFTVSWLDGSLFRGADVAYAYDTPSGPMTTPYTPSGTMPRVRTAPAGVSSCSALFATQ